LVTVKIIPKVANASTVEKNGSLKVVGTELCNSKGEPIQLRGMSSHGLQWYGDYINKNTVKALAEDWGSNVVRLAM
jgi:endoglucanase